MRGRSMIHGFVAFALALATATAAAQGTEAAGARTAPAAKGPSQERPQRASRIIGADVVNPHGEKVGDIEDIVLDSNGSVIYAIVSTGGFLGVGEKLHAVPWRALQWNASPDRFLLDVDKERLARAPGFDANNVPDLGDPKWSAANRRHFPTAPASARAGRDSPAGPPTRAERSRDRTTGQPSGNLIDPPAGPEAGTNK